jgi:hypothetical protein
VLATALAVTRAQAGWIPGGNVLASGPSNQTVPILTSDGSGGVFVFWSDDGATPGLQYVGQHVGSDGTLLWAPAGLSVPIPFNSADFSPGPITDQQGGCIVLDWSALSIAHAQRLNAVGAPQWGSSGVDLYTTPALTTGTNMIPIPAGGTSPTTDPVGVIATWEEKVSPTGTLDIYAQRLDASGAPLWGTLANPTLVCGALGDQNSEAICTDGPSGPSSTHGAYVAWYDLRNFASIYINRLSNAGLALWGSGIDLLSLNTLSSGPYMDYFGSNSALVVWTDTRVASNFGIYAQKVLPDGSVAWTPDGTLICQASGSRTGIFMTSSGSGGEILAWDDSRSDVSDVYAQAIDANGNPLWGASGVAVGVATNRQLVDGVVPDGSGGAFIFWFDRRAGTNSDLWGQHLDSNGNALWTPGGLLLVPLHITPGILELSSMSDGAGGFILAWHDKVGGNYDGFISRFDSSGNTIVLAAGPAAPESFHLALASPNPARGGAQFSIEMPSAGVLSAEVVDLQGRVVRELARSEGLSAGSHSLAWDGRTSSGGQAGPGIYFALARLGGEMRMVKLVELR